MYDISTPTDSYQKEISKLKVQIKAVDNNSELNSGIFCWPFWVTLGAKMAILGQKWWILLGKRKREKERLETMIEKLGKEQAKQQEHQKHVFSRLQRQCQNWFPARTTKNDAITTFLRLCLFPRCIFSPLDATYCARMVQLIHELRIPNFRWVLW